MNRLGLRQLLVLISLAILSGCVAKEFPVKGELLIETTEFFVGVSGVAVDPRDPSIIYVGDRRGRIAKSIDRGKTWDPLIDGTVRTLSYPTRGSIETLCDYPDCEVRDIVVDPRSPSRIFLTKIGKAFFSEDGGLQWSEVGPASSALFVKEILRWGDRLLLSATESYLERHRRAQGSRTDDIGGGLYLSEDSGASWVRALNKGTWDICVSTLNNNVGYAAGGYIFRSDDGGRTWIEKGHPPLGESSISAVEMNPKEPDIVYAATCGSPSSKSQGVFRSTDGGDSWVAQGLQGLCIKTLAVDPLHPNILYAGGGEKGHPSGTYRSVDSGKSWTSIQKRGASMALSLEPGNPGVVYEGTNLGLSRFVFAFPD